MAGSDALALGRPRWSGEPDRVEVWYATFADPDGTGYWIHYETVSPARGHGDPYAHGWVAVFPPPDRGGAPIVERFGPEPVSPAGEPDKAWVEVGDAAIGPADDLDGYMRGATTSIRWDLRFGSDQPPLYTFPQVVWERELLPGCQIVPWPAGPVQGSIHVGGQDLSVAATGQVARIYGHGNAKCWAWLHADLGDGEVLEIVTAVSRTPGLSLLPPTAMLQLRLPGEPDWPANPAFGAGRLRSRLGLPTWSVRGRVGGRRIDVTVTIPPERSVALRYEDPDMAKATCTNSETADARIVLQRRNSGTWATEREWNLAGTAHAEVGLRE